MKKKLMNTLKVFLFIAGIVSPIAVCAQRTPVEQHGQLSVVNSAMVNKEGIPPQLRGLSFGWSSFEAKKYYNPDVVDWIIRDFKVTLIRLAMGIEPKSGFLANKEEQTKLITTVADYAIAKGLYVLIDWHDHNATKHLKESKEFFSAMAKRYAGKPNVIYEIFNEPVDQSWDDIKAYSEEVIREIRKHDPLNIIVIGSPRWDQEVDRVSADPIRGYSNLVYSFHFYSSDPNHQQQLRKKADVALAAGLPLFITEWGVSESNGNGLFDRDKTAEWVKWMEKNRLSWATWHITDKNETSALLKPGASVQGGWSSDYLSENGQYIRNLLRELHK